MKTIMPAVSFVAAFILVLVFVNKTFASSENHPIFATLEKVSAMISEAIFPLKNDLGLVDDRVEKLEVSIDEISTAPQCATCTAEIAVKTVNESGAINSLASIYLAQKEFIKADFDQDGEFDYAESLTMLFKSSRLIDIVLASGTKSGYNFYLEISQNQNGWLAKANPILHKKSGDRYFYVDESGVIRFDTAQEASPSSEPIGP